MGLSPGLARVTLLLADVGDNHRVEPDDCVTHSLGELVGAVAETKSHGGLDEMGALNVELPPRCLDPFPS